MKNAFRYLINSLSLAAFMTAAAILMATPGLARADVSVTAPQQEDFIFFVQVQIKPEMIASFKALLVPYAGMTRQEAGNVQYVITQSPQDPSSFMLMEHWASAAGRAAHLSQPYTVKFFANAGPMFMPGFPARTQFTELRGLN